MSFERIRRIRKPFENLFGKSQKPVETSGDPVRRPPTIPVPTEVKLAQMAKEEEERNKNIVYPKMVPTIYSYYADFQNNGYYKNYAMNLISRCKTFGVNYNITEKTSRGSYGANCLMKPEFIIEKLKESKKPLIWMDCDTDFKFPFIEFNHVTEDIGMATHSGDLSGIKASPLFFNYTPGSFKIVREWLVHCRSAFIKGIPELDHDALKHYVLPSLLGKYSVFLLSNNWGDFVNGKYIHNGNSKVDGKMETHRKVNVDDRVRAKYSSDVKTMYVYFSDLREDVFKVSLNFLEKFSDYSRLVFHFDQNLEKTSCNSQVFHKLYIESGANTYFSDKNYESHSPLSNEIVLKVNDVKDIEKSWDYKITESIKNGKNPLHYLNFEDEGMGIIKIKNESNLWE